MTVVSLLASLVLQGPASTIPADRLNEQWWRERHEQKLAQLKERSCDVLFIGDSITHGWDQDLGSETGHTFSAYFGDRKVINIGYSGDRTEHVLWRFEHGELDGVKPKLAILMIGTNNLGSGQSVDDTVIGIKAVIESFHAKLPRTKLLLLGVFPRRDSIRDIHLTDQVNAKIQAFNKLPMVTYLNIDKAFLNAQNGIDRSVMPDGLHPNAYGYYLWAQAEEPTVRKLIGAQPNSAVIPQPGIESDMYIWQDRHNAVMAEKSKGKVDFVMIGDSITHFWGGRPVETLQRGNAVWEDYYGARNPLNLGFGWDRTQQVLWRINHGELDGIQPKAITLLIGTNNLTPGRVRAYTNDEIVAGVKAIISAIQRRCPSAKLIVQGILPRGYSPLNIDRVRILEINEMLANIPNIDFIDSGSSLLQPDGTFKPMSMVDGLHPTDLGYAYIADALEPRLADIFGDAKPHPRPKSLVQISQAGWSIISVDSENFVGENDRAVNAIDGNPATIWHTEFSPNSPKPPHQIVVDMWTSRDISAMEFMPRPEGIQNGRIGQCEIYLSDDLNNFGAPVAKGAMPTNGFVTFANPVRARYLKLIALTEAQGQAWTSVAEIRAFRWQ